MGERVIHPTVQYHSHFSDAFLVITDEYLCVLFTSLSGSECVSADDQINCSFSSGSSLMHGPDF